MRRLTLAVALCLACGATFAETYRGIGPFDTLADLRNKFPGANFKELHPAWAQLEDVMWSITGPGMSGTTIVKLFDIRPSWREELSKANGQARESLLKQLAELPDDEAVTVSWVRWVPNSPIPLERYITKYGPPEKSGFSDENMQPYKTWVSKGLSVWLSDDGKSVGMVDFEFTKAERAEAWRSRARQALGQREARTTPPTTLAPNSGSPQRSTPQQSLGPVVVLTTSLGSIKLVLDPEKAPVTVNKFLEYVRAEFYNGTVFHRVIPNFVIEGGRLTPDLKDKPLYPDLRNEERPSGMRSSRGTVAMAHSVDARRPTVEFLINVKDNANDSARALNIGTQGGGYTIFGQVVEGMAVVDKIAGVPTGTRTAGDATFSNVPLDPVIILSAREARRASAATGYSTKGAQAAGDAGRTADRWLRRTVAERARLNGE